jgi:hypothetical protein
MKCKDCACSDVCYYKAFNDVRAVKRRDDVEKICKSFVHRDSIKVDAVEVVHGRWIYEPVEFSIVKDIRCSVCGRYVKVPENYCSDCGAKMDGDGND